jgi:hypothetical protein
LRIAPPVGTNVGDWAAIELERVIDDRAPIARYILFTAIQDTIIIIQHLDYESRSDPLSLACMLTTMSSVADTQPGS